MAHVARHGEIRMCRNDMMCSGPFRGAQRDKTVCTIAQEGATYLLFANNIRVLSIAVVDRKGPQEGATYRCVIYRVVDSFKRCDKLKLAISLN